jgi:outer membrane protein assembly factor BamB
MIRPTHLLLLPLTTLLAPAFATLLAGPLAAQQGSDVYIPERSVERPIDFAAGQDDNLFSVLRSQEQIHEFEQGLNELAAGAHDAGVERLHRLLQTDSGGVVPVAPGRFLGLRLVVVTALANLPPLATDAYERLVATEIQALGSDLPTMATGQLLQLAERFPTASIGRRARLRLGDLALTTGDAETAVGHFRSALDATAIGSADERRICERLAATSLLLDPAAAAATLAERPTPLVRDVLAAAAPFDSAASWLAYGGGRDGRTPMAEPAGKPQRVWLEDVRADGFVRREISQFAMHATGDLGGLFVNTGREVICFEPLRTEGNVRWVSTSPLGDADDGYEDSTNQDMVLAAACDARTVVGALQVPEGSMNVDFHGGFRIMSKIPLRRLFAFDRDTGKVLWSHFDELDGPTTRRLRGHDACGPPLIAGDTVFAPIHDRSGAIAFAVAAYDLRTGKPRWRRLVCSSQQDVNMFGNARSEFAASPLCQKDGVLYGASNLGIAFAIEAATGRLRWIASYDVVRMPRTMLHNQAERPVYFANNAPVAAAGTVCLTPLDSQFVIGLDTETGRQRWRLSTDARVGGIDHRVLWLCGAFEDEFVLAGAGCVAVAAQPAGSNSGTAGSDPVVRSLASPEQLSDRRDARLPARPAMTADHVYVPRHDRIVAIDRAGNRSGDDRLQLKHYQPGNLLLVGGVVVSLRQRALELLFDGASMLAMVQRELATDADAPTAILRLASLRSALLPATADAATAAAVVDLYRRGLAACDRRGYGPGHPLRLRLMTDLFQQRRALADAALAQQRADALPLLVAARDDAPDQKRWVELQALVLQQHAADPIQQAAELERLLQRAADATFPLGTGLPVPTYVLWQQALGARDASAAVRKWQQLLSEHGEVPLPGGPARAVAAAAIGRLVAANGEGVYAEFAAAAAAQLAAAGEDRDRLEALATRFPNSAAAATARGRLLDLAVRAGDLAAAATVLAQVAATGSIAPGILRRVAIAARHRGNHELAAAMLRLLTQGHGDDRSDWPDDAGRTFAAIAATERTNAPAPEARAEPMLPLAELGRIVPAGAGDFLRPLAVHHADGFAARADAPLFLLARSELRAIDIHATAAEKPVLFRLPIQFVEHLVLCGDTLVVPDMDRVFAVDYRTGQLRWQFVNGGDRLLESLGTTDGVLLLSLQPATALGDCEFAAVEPLTGTVLYTQALPADQQKPKVGPGFVLRLAPEPAGGAVIDLLEATTGARRRRFEVPATVLPAGLLQSPDSLTSRVYSQWLASDGERVLLPIEPNGDTDPPRLCAIDARGQLAWQWTGEPGTRFLVAAPHADAVAIVVGSDGGRARVLVLDGTTGQLRSETEAGFDAVVHNWERGWLCNPAPAALVIEAFADAEHVQRQLLHCAVAKDRPTFVVDLPADSGDVVRTPQLTSQTLTFAVRPQRSGPLRLFSLDLGDRSGRFPDGQKQRRVGESRGGSDELTAVGRYLVLGSSGGLLLLGDPAHTADTTATNPNGNTGK